MTTNNNNHECEFCLKDIVLGEKCFIYLNEEDEELVYVCSTCKNELNGSVPESVIMENGEVVDGNLYVTTMEDDEEEEDIN
jgi:hypothetical protein